MKVKIIQNSWFANKIVGKNITLYPFIFLMQDLQTSSNNFMLAHEWIHITQVRKLGFLRFYFTYLLYYLKGIFRYRNLNEAYENISYEVEAYENQTTFVLPSPLE